MAFKYHCVVLPSHQKWQNGTLHSCGVDRPHATRPRRVTFVSTPTGAIPHTTRQPCLQSNCTRVPLHHLLRRQTHHVFPSRIHSPNSSKHPPALPSSSFRAQSISQNTSKIRAQTDPPILMPRLTRLRSGRSCSRTTRRSTRMTPSG